MAIKISDLAPVKKFLVEADPDGDTWIMIKPITYRDDMARGELLKQREVHTSATGATVSTGLNMYQLRAEELWLTYADAHVVLEAEDGTKTEPFEPRDEMARQDFLRALTKLPPRVVLEWYSKMLEVNPDWAFPF